MAITIGPVVHPIKVDVTCPTCGKTGTAKVKRQLGSIRTISAPEGFYITLTGSTSLHISCESCKAPVYSAT